MSFVAKTAFEHRIGHRDVDDNVAGLYQASNANADCSAGWLVTPADYAPNEGFANIDNENTYIMNDATDATVDNIYACNPYDARLIADGDNAYFVGRNTLGIGAPAGRYAAYTRIRFDGIARYRFGEGNLSAALSTNTYCTIDDGKLVPAASAPATAGTPYFEVVGTGKFTEGTRASFGYVDVVGKIAVAAAE